VTFTTFEVMNSCIATQQSCTRDIERRATPGRFVRVRSSRPRTSRQAIHLRTR
jgi:hypothetical protein